MASIHQQLCVIVVSILLLSLGCCSGELREEGDAESSDALSQPGTLSWIRPSDGQIVTASIVLEVSASARVDFAVDGVRIASDTLRLGPPPRSEIRS